jgi:DNA-binding transcriptional ArsR family regulator
MDESQVVSALSALSQETRLRILRHLVRAGPEGATAGAVGEAVGAAASRASFHLAALTQAGLITKERISRHIVYRADFAAMGALLGYLVQDCCGGHEGVVACCVEDGCEQSGCEETGCEETGCDPDSGNA